MGSDRGGYIVTSLGPVTVAPLPPFEWKGVNKIDVGETGFKNLEPVMVVSGCTTYGRTGMNHYFELFLQGKNLKEGEFNGQTLNMNIDNISLAVGTMEFSSIEPDGSHLYLVNFELDENEYNDMTSFRFSPPDRAFEVTCVDLNKV